MARKQFTKAQKEQFEFQKSKDYDLTIDEAVVILGIKTKQKFNDITFRRAWFWQMVYDHEKNIKPNINLKLLSLAKLGKITGGQTHATVLFGIKQARKNEIWLRPYKDEVEKIVKRIKFLK